jgi:hypothetical protein
MRQILRQALTALLVLFTLTVTFGDLNIEPAGIASTSASTPDTFSAESMTHFTVSTPSYVTAGQPFTVTVTAKDANDQTVTDYSGTVYFTSTDAAAGVTLPADFTFTAADNGVHTFTNAFTLASSVQGQLQQLTKQPNQLPAQAEPSQ